jgi:hypothetical protein
MKTDTFQKIAEHDHTGAGKGKQIGTGALVADGVTGAKIRLDNQEYLRGRNQADSANIDMFKIDGGDEINVGATITSATITSATITTGTITTGTIPTSNQTQINATGSKTLADNQSATTAAIITLSADEACSIHYSIVRSTDVQKGVLECSESGDLLFDEYIGTDTGVTFSLNAGVLEYATTSTGNTAALIYSIIKQ